MRALAVLLTSLVVLAPPALAAFPSGSWFGRGEPGDKNQMWLAQMLPGGEFRVHFRACRRKEGHDSIETGHWSLKGDIETIDIATVNGAADPRQDVYQILFQDGRKQSYRYLQTGFVYNSVQVDANFHLPPCGLMS